MSRARSQPGTASTPHLFGPVPSRRFGWSLGVDLVPFKTCSYDCVFCEVGRTTDRTLERREFVPVDVLCGELEQWLAGGGTTDFITLAGAGEPTLHSGLGVLLDRIGRLRAARRAVLTNGSLLHLPEVRAEAARSDVVKVSCSTVDAGEFHRLHRPHPGLRLDRLLEGLKAFRAEFRGELWVEVFVVPGINDGATSIGRLAAYLGDVRPDRIHLNTAVRPPADPDTPTAPAERLGAMAAQFTPVAEVVASFQGVSRERGGSAEERILAHVARRPAPADELAQALGIPRDAVDGILGALLGAGRIRCEARNGVDFYRVAG